MLHVKTSYCSDTFHGFTLIHVVLINYTLHSILEDVPTDQPVLIQKILIFKIKFPIYDNNNRLFVKY